MALAWRSSVEFLKTKALILPLLVKPPYPSDLTTHEYDPPERAVTSFTVTWNLRRTIHENTGKSTNRSFFTVRVVRGSLSGLGTTQAVFAS